MNRKYELQTVIRALFLIYRLSPPVAAKLAELDYEALSQALNYNAEPIYRFRTDNYSEERCEYRSENVPSPRRPRSVRILTVRSTVFV